MDTRKIIIATMVICILGCTVNPERIEYYPDVIRNKRLESQYDDAIWAFYLMYFDKKCSGFEKLEKPANNNCTDNNLLGFASLKFFREYDASQNYMEDSLQGISFVYSFKDCDCIEVPPIVLSGSYSDSSIISDYIFNSKGELVYLENRIGIALDLRIRKDLYDKIYSPSREDELKYFIQKNINTCDTLLIKEAKRRKVI